ncbi:MAG: hypothetical protein ACI8W7_000163 [Gammaproteobacteria bacterium]|jgi:hypothetical protein
MRFPRHASPELSEELNAQAALLTVEILPQPDDETCGPTCLQAVYQYWGDDISLAQVIDSVRTITAQGRGTLAVMLGIHALRRGYAARLYTFNVQVFDPTWFNVHGDAEPRALCDKLARQLTAKAAIDVADTRLHVATDSYLEFLRLGGVIRFRDLTSRLISSAIRKGLPVLTGLSATYLYRCAREFGPNDDYDDIRGEPAGHFVVLHGYDPRGRRVTVADPLANNPGFDSQRYTVAMARLVPAIMLGVLTYDANLLVIEPRQSKHAEFRNKGKKAVPIQ